MVVRVGLPAPPLCLADLRGERRCLEDLRGRPAILVFLRYLG
jgi:peroxiredoxin